jgi:hypothetical protein
MTTPRKVKVAGQTFRVEERYPKDDGMLSDGNYAYTLDTGNLIVIDKTLGLSKKQQTLLHEVMHAIRMVHDGTKKPSKKDGYGTWEHHFIGIWEAGLMAFLKDNPEVVEWITSDE